MQPDRLENLGAAVTAHRGDAHLGKNLEQAFFERFDIILDRILDRQAGFELAEIAISATVSNAR